MESSEDKKPVSGLDEFRAALLDYKSVSSWAMSGTVAIPLVDYVVRLGPPWPWAGGVPIITSVAELLTLICVFHFWSRSTRRLVSRRIVILIVLLVICFGAYLYHNSAFTFSTPVGEKFVKGFTLTPEAALLITPEYPTEAMLEEFGYRPDAVWTPSSITVMRLILLFLWLLSFIFLSAAIASFVMYHRRSFAGSPDASGSNPTPALG